MSRVEKISVALPSEMIAGVKAAVDAGQYATTSEVIRDALRDWGLKRRFETMERDDLRRLVNEGIESGPSVDAKPVIDRLRAKYAAASERP